MSASRREKAVALACLAIGCQPDGTPCEVDGLRIPAPEDPDLRRLYDARLAAQRARLERMITTLEAFLAEDEIGDPEERRLRLHGLIR